MSDMDPANPQQHPGGLVAANNDQPLPATKPVHVSKIPPSFAPELLRRREELGWTLRGLSEWLSEELKVPVSHRAVDRFLQGLQKKAWLEAQRPFRENLTLEMAQIAESLSEERRLVDDTEEELARKKGKSPEVLKELDADLARSHRKIRSLVAQFNAYGKHVPKPDSRAVPVCTPDSSHSTGSEPSPNPAAADCAQPPSAEPDSRAVPVCTPDSNRFTGSEPPPNRPTSAPPSPAVQTPLVPVSLPTPEGYTTPENANWLARLLPQAGVHASDRPMSFGEWIASQPEALLGRPIEIDPSWKNHPSDAIFIDLSRHASPAEMAKKLVSTRPEQEYRVVFVLARDTASDVLKKMSSFLNAPLMLPLTKQKLNVALKSVAASKRKQEERLRTRATPTAGDK